MGVGGKIAEGRWARVDYLVYLGKGQHKAGVGL